MPYVTWTDGAIAATARDDVAGAVRAALGTAGSLYAWAAHQEPRQAFRGRGEAYGVTLGPGGAVVRHARRGGLLAPLLGDRYVGTPRFEREIAMAERLAAAGVATPVVLAGVRYGGLVHRADVATAWMPGRDLVTILFAQDPPAGEAREALWRAVAGLVRRLHDAGFVHPDLQLRNVLYDAGGGRAWLLDVDTCREAGADAGPRRRNLRRFYRSWGKLNLELGGRLTSGDKRAFEVAYRAAP